MKKKILLSIFLVVALVSLLAASDWSTPARAAEKSRGPVKIALIRAFTGIAVVQGKDISHGADYAAWENGYEVAGRPIIVIEADEYQTPERAVAAAKKLVEDDKVDVVLGPLFAHSSIAVAAYAERAGVPHVSVGPIDEEAGKHTFFTFGSGRGLAYPGGQYVYEVMGARTASMLYQDYLYGEQNRDGFAADFTSRGGKMIYTAAVPFGAPDMAGYLAGIGKPDVLAVMLVGPDGLTFVRQYHDYGLKTPIFFTSPTLETEDLLQVAGERASGIYGTNTYSPNIDTPRNNEFVRKFKEKYGDYPAQPTMWGYWAMHAYLEALKATKGDTDSKRITKALLNLKMDTPAGPMSFTPGRVALHPVYIFQIVKKDRYTWGVVRQYPAPLPVGPPK